MEDNNTPQLTLDRRIFLYTLASMAAVADIITIYQLLIGGTFAQHFSTSWVASILIIVVLSTVALGCVFLANQSQHIAKYFALYWGLFYIILACIIFQVNAYKNLHISVTWTSFLGIMISTLLIGGFGMFSMAVYTDRDISTAVEDKIFRFPSYIFGVNSIVYLYLLAGKYVGDLPFESGSDLISELILLVYSSTLFIWTFFESLKGEKAGK